MKLLSRNISRKADELLRFFPVVIILGVRQCGKTTLARMLRPDWRYYDLERSNDFDRVTDDFDFFIKEHSNAVIIDEAQRFPDLFRELRGVVDRDRQRKDRFLLTVSSSPSLIRGVSESLAGRVGLIELGTLKSNEIHSLELPAFYQVFDQELGSDSIRFLRGLGPVLSHNQIMAAFLKGGYPEPILQNDERFFELWMENYRQAYVERDVRTLFPRLNLVKYQRFISMLSALSGTVINRSQVARSLDISEKSVRDYLEIAQGGYIWRNVPSFEGSVAKSIVKMPKGYFRDSGLAHFIQGINTREKLLNHPSVGADFEAFVFEEILKGLQATSVVNWHYYYFRTRNGAEIDLILKGPFGTLPIEIKLGTRVKKRQIQTIRNFVDDNALPLGIVINNNDHVDLLSEKIVQVPAGCI